METTVLTSTTDLDFCKFLCWINVPFVTMFIFQKRRRGRLSRVRRHWNRPISWPVPQPVLRPLGRWWLVQFQKLACFSLKRVGSHFFSSVPETNRCFLSKYKFAIFCCFRSAYFYFFIFFSWTIDKDCSNGVSFASGSMGASDDSSAEDGSQEDAWLKTAKLFSAKHESN